MPVSVPRRCVYPKDLACGWTVATIVADKEKKAVAAQAAAQAQLRDVPAVEISGLAGAIGEEYNGVYLSKGVNWNGWPRFASAQGLQLFRCVAGTPCLICFCAGACSRS